MGATHGKLDIEKFPPAQFILCKPCFMREDACLPIGREMSLISFLRSFALTQKNQKVKTQQSSLRTGQALARCCVFPPRPQNKRFWYNFVIVLGGSKLRLDLNDHEVVKPLIAPGATLGLYDPNSFGFGGIDVNREMAVCQNG